MSRRAVRTGLGWRVPAATVVASLTVAGCGSADQAPSAADQVPRLEVVLQHIDSALAAHHFGLALQQLHALKADVVRARDAGDLRPDDAARVLDAASRLVKLVPDETTTAPPSTPSPTATSHSPEPSTSGGPKTRHPSSPSPTPSFSPSPTPSSTSPTPSPTSSPDPTPTGGATRDVSPTVSPTTGP
jgi:hypothetical protein